MKKLFLLIGLSVIGIVFVFLATQNEFDQNNTSVIVISKPYEITIYEKFDIMNRGIQGKVTKIIDAETLEIKKMDGTSMIITLALVDPHVPFYVHDNLKTGLKDVEYPNPVALIARTCSVGSFMQFVQDSGQPTGLYSKGIGLVYCNDKLLNELLLRSGEAKIPHESCKVSEFADETWAKDYGCSKDY